MLIVNNENLKPIAALFEGWNHTSVRAALEGKVGEVWADDEKSPNVAKIIIGTECFFAGDMNNEGAKELLLHIPPAYEFEEMQLFPINESWDKLIEAMYYNEDPEQYEKYFRYSFKKDSSLFNKVKLEKFTNQLTNEYKIVPFDEKLFHTLQKQEWSQFHGSNFSTFADFENHGVGYVILFNDKPVCCASSYLYYEGGIEIQIDTVEAHRKKGLATACVARLILACLNRGIYPNWDAANKKSMELAKKLGYSLDKVYTIHEIACEK